MDRCPYCGSEDISRGTNYKTCLTCGFTWGNMSHPDIMGSIDNIWLKKNGLKESWTGGVYVHSVDKGLMYPQEGGFFTDIITYTCQKCGYSWHTYNAGP